jgi:toxin FitB
LIILDTNVLSELMQKAPDPSVVEWLDRQPVESVWITSITLFEARLGLALLPSGRRRQALELAFEQLLAEDLERRVLDFDRSAAEAVAVLAAERQQNGRTVDMRDTQIAGIVIARRAALATRNVKHFADITAEVVNPWEAKR